MKFRLLIALIVALTLTAMGCSSDSDDAADDPAAVVNQYVAAYNTGDIDAVMAVYTEDSVIHAHPTGPSEVAGLTAIRRLHVSDLAAAGASADEYSISNVEVDGDTVTWDQVWVNAAGQNWCRDGLTAVIKDGKMLTWTWSGQSVLCP